MADGGMANASFTVPSCYVDLSPVAVGAFGLVAKAKVVPGSIRPNNAFFARLSTDQVAIKRIASSMAFKDCYHAKQVYREISLLKQLTHENIIKLVDLFCSPQGDMYIITEAMDCDLGRILSGDPGTFELLAAHVKWIMYQLLRGLRYLHSGGVLHRDLKPQNILVNQAMSIRICDLGLARTNQQQDGLATGYVTTRWYRAPEVMLTWQHYTTALDMWSAGCIFAVMLNRANGNVTFQDSQGQTYFALFPSESHDEHLKRIIQFVGAPSAQIVANIGVAAIRDFVQGTIEEMKAQPARSLAENMNLQDQDAAFLLMQLLDWDPLRRLSANDAVQVPYIQEYREDDAGDARGPVDTQFEELDVPVEMWRQVIETEIGNLEAVEATGLSAAQMAQTDILEAALAAETVDLPSPTLLAGEMNALSMDASLPEMSAQGAATSMPALNIPALDGTVSDEYDAQHQSMVMNHYETEADYLMGYLSDPQVSANDRGPIINAIGEVNSRLSMMKNAQDAQRR